MKLDILTVDQLRNDKAREYNPQVWNEKIDGFLTRTKDVQFYKVPAGDGYQYDRFFVKRTISEGITLFSSFGYSSCLSSNSFGRVRIIDGQLVKGGLTSEGEEVRIKNEKEGRKVMANLSKNLGYIFSNEF